MQLLLLLLLLLLFSALKLYDAFSQSLSHSVRVIWYKGTVTTEIQHLDLKDGQMDGRTNIDGYCTRLSSQNF